MSSPNLGITSQIFALLRWLALASILAGATGSALATKIYSDHFDGTVIYPTIGLTWMRNFIIRYFCLLSLLCPALAWAATPMVAAGSGHTVALKADGTVMTWGQNYAGELGDGTKTQRNSPIAVPGLTDVTMVAAGNSFTVALKSDGTVMTWGSNAVGELGDNSYQYRLTPAPVPGLTNIVSISTTSSHTLALKSDGTVVTWGYNLYGQLGDGTTTNRNNPVSVPGLSNVVEISGGTFASIAIKADGTVWAWGYNQYGGSLCDGGMTDHPNPILAIALENAVTVTNPGYLSTALKSNGKVVTCDASGVRSVPELTGIVAVVDGGNAKVALQADGRVMTWGSNSYGGLGDPSLTIWESRSIPAYVSGLSGIVTVAAAAAHTVALKADGSVFTWGRGDYGVLGDGTSTSRPSPTAVPGLNLGVSSTSQLVATALTFSSQNVGSTGTPQILTLTNTGSGPLHTSIISISGNFTRSTNCSSYLAPSSDCTISVTFAPMAAGIEIGTLSVGSNGVILNSVSLSGTSVGSVASLNTTSLGFVAQNLGTTSTTEVVTLTNTGNVPLNITSITTTGDFAVTNNCGTGLGVGGFCALNINFSPTATGTRTGTITITDDAFDSPQSISLTGIGQGAVASLTGSILATPPSGFGSFFANTNVGDTSTLTFTLSNTGGDILNISGMTVSGDFTKATTCGTTLNLSSSCSITISFLPTVAGARTGSLVINSDSANGTVTLGLNGTGVAVPVVSLSLTSLSFAAQTLGTSSATQVVKLTNSGGAALNLTSITASGDFVVTNNCGSGLGAGGFCNLSVTFTPTAAGNRIGAITIASNAAGNPHSISLNGQGVALAPSQPASVSATPGTGQATVSFAAPSSDGGSPVTGYTVISNPAGGVDSDAGTTALTHTVTGLANGTAYTFTVVAANSAGSSVASASSNSVTPVQIGQTISFGSAPTLVVGGTGTLTATGGASGNAVTFITATSTICTISGSTVTAVAVGSCIVTANQAGNANYSAAAQVTQTITVTQSATTTVSFVQGWNLLGNSLDQAFSVVPALADPAIVTTVWKWDVVANGWQFYSPSLQPADLQTYAASKGYGVLSSINPGEGYWVNARVAATVSGLMGSAFTLGSANLVKGWNLLATGNDVAPAAFNLSLSATPPSVGIIPNNLTSLWAWDSTLLQWYFYAPSLEASGGLGNYVTGKGYLDFTKYNKTLGSGVGFWVNIP